MRKVNIKKHPAYQYALDVQNGNEVAGKYIKTVAKRFIKEINEGSKCDYYFSTKFLAKLDMFLQNINMATGSRAGESVYDSLEGFQWFLLVNVLCWRLKDDHKKRRYQTATLLIARKNSKTFLSAIIFILLLLLEPKYSSFYSVAPDKELSGQILREIKALIDASPVIRDYFVAKKGEVDCLPKKSTFTNLANAPGQRLDGREPSVYLCDETGALPTAYPLIAMQKGQLTVPNKLGIIISTAYPTLHNPMVSEVIRAKDKISDGRLYDPTYFALLYLPDKPLDWMTDFNQVLQVNPLAQHIPDIKNTIHQDWEDAINYKDKRQEFLTKTMNVFVDGEAGEQFVSEDDVNKCVINDFDWSGRDVYIGFDFALTNDNFGLTMLTKDEESHKFVVKSWAFYPANKEAQKSKVESIDYHEAAQRGWGIPSGQNTIDYTEAENFAMGLAEAYNVNVVGMGYDKWSAQSSVAKFEHAGYQCIQILQGAGGEFQAAQLLRDSIQNGNFAFTPNDLYKQNLINANMVKNRDLTYYLDKKKSKGKIDMAAATVDALGVYLAAQLNQIEYSGKLVDSLSYQ